MTELSAPQIAAMQKHAEAVLRAVFDDVARRQHIVALVLEHVGPALKPDDIVKLVIDLHRFVTLPADVARSAEVVDFKDRS